MVSAKLVNSQLLSCSALNSDAMMGCVANSSEPSALEINPPIRRTRMMRPMGVEVSGTRFASSSTVLLTSADPERGWSMTIDGAQFSEVECQTLEDAGPRLLAREDTLF
jgi:hypothetical protein